MTVYRGTLDKTYRYDFEYRKHRYWGSTGQSKKRAAEEYERKVRIAVEREAAGLPPETPVAADASTTSPKVQDWASVFLDEKAKRGRKVKGLARDLAVALKFFGQAPPDVERSDDEPYHHLTLLEIERDINWVERFEQWMRDRHAHAALFGAGRKVVGVRRTRRKIGASARNHLRSAMSGMFKVALLARHRPITKVTLNPWAFEPRETTPRRVTMVTTEQLRAWINASSYHVKLALAIAALAPKLRLSNVLSLRWGQEVNLRGGLITVEHHKTLRTTKLPLVVPISDMLGVILAHAHARRDRDCSCVIAYRGRPVKSIYTGLRKAAKRANVRYGLKGGATFHTLRHYAGTTLAALGVSEALRMDTMGWTDAQTPRVYTHLVAQHLRAPLAQLASATPLQDLFLPAGAKSSTNLPTNARNGHQEVRNP